MSKKMLFENSKKQKIWRDKIKKIKYKIQVILNKSYITYYDNNVFNNYEFYRNWW